MQRRPLKRVLVLAYYFPPSGGAGVQRVLKFVKYLRDFGWEPVVLTVAEGSYPKQDVSLWDDVPPGVAVHRTPTAEPFAWYARLTGKSRENAVISGSFESHRASWQERLGLWLRGNVFLPDARVGWVPFATAAGRKLLRQGSFDALLTSGPPHSVHLAGLALHTLHGTPWLADFRDPWMESNYYHELPHSDLALRLDRMLERQVVRRASAVATVSPGWRNLLAAKVPPAERHRFAVIHNGYDEEDFATSAAPPEDTFVVSYVGSLYASRNHPAVWEALGRLHARGAVPHLRIRLVGSVDPGVDAALRRHGLKQLTEKVPYLPHAEAVAAMQRSTLLLLLVESFSESKGMLTGKIYEYMAAGCPVLGVGPPDGDAAALLQETGAGRLLSPHDVDGLAEHVLRHYEAWEGGKPSSGAPREAVAHYSRRSQTQHLARLLDVLGRADK